MRHSSSTCSLFTLINPCHLLNSRERISGLRQFRRLSNLYSMRPLRSTALSKMTWHDSQLKSISWVSETFSRPYSWFLHLSNSFIRYTGYPDEDNFGNDCLGSTLIPLHRIRAQQTRSFSLHLDKSQNVSPLLKTFSSVSILIFFWVIYLG